MAKYQTLCEFIAEFGGMRSIRGNLEMTGASDLRSIGADAWHKAKPFRKKLVRLESGLTPDAATLAAYEAGYFPEFNERPTTHDLIEAIDRELAGSPVYTLDDSREIYETEMAEYEREMTIEALHESAVMAAASVARVEIVDVPGRAIPKDSELIQGAAGEAVYIYFQYYINKKGHEGKTYYAKAFRAGERNHEWHKAFSTHEKRDDAINEFFSSSFEVA